LLSNIILFELRLYRSWVKWLVLWYPKLRPITHC